VSSPGVTWRPAEPGDEVVDGLPAHHDAAGLGFAFVVMVMPLGREPGR
jgi:hypothetical protein